MPLAPSVNDLFGWAVTVSATDGMYLFDTRVSVLEKLMQEGAYLLDRRAFAVERYALDKVFVSDTAIKVLEKFVREGIYASDTRTQVLEKLLRDGTYLKDTLQRIEEHGFRDGLYTVDAAYVQRVKQLLARDGIYLSDSVVAELIVAGGQLFAVAMLDSLLLADTGSRETPGVLVYALLRSLDFLGVQSNVLDLVGARADSAGWVFTQVSPDVLGVQIDGQDLVGVILHILDLLVVQI